MDQLPELLTAGEMRRLEQRAVSAGHVTGSDLMARAGAGVVDAITEAWPLWQAGSGASPHRPADGPPGYLTPEEVPGRVLVLCGPGNNGGDGFVIARLLAARGWAVDLRLFGARDRLPADAAAHAALWEKVGETRAWDAGAIKAGARPDVIVDAVFGIGLTRGVPAAVAEVFAVCRAGWPDGGRPRVVAVDCPSGLDLDTGRVPGAPEPVCAADLTVTFHSPRPGHFLARGPEVCGHLRVVDIGLSDTDTAGRMRLLDPGFGGTAQAVPRWPLTVIGKARRGGHKYEHGHVVVFAGGVGRGGAGRLAARAALRVGAGLVTLVCPPAELQENAARLDAVMVRSLRKDQRVGDIADDRVSAFCLGPGLGVGARTRALVLEVLGRRGAEPGQNAPAVVLDADALSSFSNDPEVLFAALHDRAVLTPHGGEFARLFPDLARRWQDGGSKADAAQAAARRAGCTVLLKGADTVIASPDGAICLHAAAFERAVPWLATAGAGDVLAGMIAGIAAPSDAGDPVGAAQAAAWLHVECARVFGPGLIAEDLADMVPRVLAGLAR
ncbi:NAD(P)H-hydrate dehydratase [uncultured Roseobacter sp.]|uniref:NAD(P)H-hydrate dehydratase n=1 Tax=uncultured Roseobacter sp. TaxID=114847 RepID=UPI0026379D74|nr:NAD(P)H-hydrate dehydratase [uncultured Roseobacter sp.]